jgi:hypothetical protein
MKTKSELGRSAGQTPTGRLRLEREDFIDPHGWPSDPTAALGILLHGDARYLVCVPGGMTEISAKMC